MAFRYVSPPGAKKPSKNNLAAPLSHACTPGVDRLPTAWQAFANQCSGLIVPRLHIGTLIAKVNFTESAQAAAKAHGKKYHKKTLK